MVPRSQLEFLRELEEQARQLSVEAENARREARRLQQRATICTLLADLLAGRTKAVLLSYEEVLAFVSQCRDLRVAEVFGLEPEVGPPPSDFGVSTRVVKLVPLRAV